MSTGSWDSRPDRPGPLDQHRQPGGVGRRGSARLCPSGRGGTPHVGSGPRTGDPRTDRRGDTDPSPVACRTRARPVHRRRPPRPARLAHEHRPQRRQRAESPGRSCGARLGRAWIDRFRRPGLDPTGCSPWPSQRPTAASATSGRSTPSAPSSPATTRNGRSNRTRSTCSSHPYAPGSRPPSPWRAVGRQEQPENVYRSASERAAWMSLERLAGLDDTAARARLDADCARTAEAVIRSLDDATPDALRDPVDRIRNDPTTAPGPQPQPVLPSTARDRARLHAVSLRSRRSTLPRRCQQRLPCRAQPSAGGRGDPPPSCPIEHQHPVSPSQPRRLCRALDRDPARAARGLLLRVHGQRSERPRAAPGPQLHRPAGRDHRRGCVPTGIPPA